MREEIIEEKIIKLLIQPNHTQVEVAKITYGVKSLISDFYKLLIVYGVSIALDCLKYVIIMHLTFYILRQVCFGYHFSGNFQCITWSIILFPFLCRLGLIIPASLGNYLLVICSIILLILAPTGTKKHSVINKNHYTYLKKHVFYRLSIIWVIIVLVPPSIEIFITLGLVVQALLVITQYIINQKEGKNDEYYRKY